VCAQITGGHAGPPLQQLLVLSLDHGFVLLVRRRIGVNRLAIYVGVRACVWWGRASEGSQNYKFKMSRAASECFHRTPPHPFWQEVKLKPDLCSSKRDLTRSRHRLIRQKPLKDLRSAELPIVRVHSWRIAWQVGRNQAFRRACFSARALRLTKLISLPNSEML
jgi:hypothetical protein